MFITAISSSNFDDSLNSRSGKYNFAESCLFKPKTLQIVSLVISPSPYFFVISLALIQVESITSHKVPSKSNIIPSFFLYLRYMVRFYP